MNVAPLLQGRFATFVSTALTARSTARLAGFLATTLLLAQPAAAQINLNTQVVSGTVSFANVNTDAVNGLLSMHLQTTHVTLTSTNPGGYLASTDSSFSGTSAPYSLSAEALGTSGQVAYGGTASIIYGGGGSNYSFSPQSVTLTPAAPATLNFSDVVTVHYIEFGTNADCSDPLEVSSAQVTPNNAVGAAHFFGPTSSGYIIVPGDDTPNPGTITVTSGSDPYSNTLTQQLPIDLSGAGDALVVHCIMIATNDGTGGGDSSLGEIKTTASMPGYTFGTPDFTNEAHGPNGNTRNSYTTPGTTQTLDFINLVPGSWALNAVFLLNPGGIETEFTTLSQNTPFVDIPVAAGAVTDGTEDFGSLAIEPFAFDPAFYTGSLLFYDAYVAAHPNATSTLSSLILGQDFLINGQSFNTPLGTTGIITQGTVGQSAATSFGGTFSPSTGALSSSYTMPVGLIYNQPENWLTVPFITLQFSSPAFANSNGNTPGPFNEYTFAVAGNDPNAAALRQGALEMYSGSFHDAPLAAGQTINNDLHYCFNEVVIQIQSANTLFVNPGVTISGGYSGVDFEGNSVDYQILSAGFTGTPYVGSSNALSVFMADRASSGSVSFALPQGSYTLAPNATTIDDSGGFSQGTFNGTTLPNLGCGQRVTLVPGLSVSLDAPNACEAPVDGVDGVTLSGSVNSGGAELDHVWYTINGGAEIDICNVSTGGSCQSAFSVPVALLDGDNVISVSATSPFITGTSSIGETISCNGGGCGASCVVPPPTCTAAVYAPDDQSYGMLSFEDLWPNDGDLDFNDETIAWHYSFVLDASNNVSGFDATFDALAMGAEVDNGLYLHLLIPIGSAGNAWITVGSGNTLTLTPLSTLGVATQLTEVVYMLTPDIRALFGGAPGFINTQGTSVTPSTPITLSVRFGAAQPQGTNGFDLSTAPFDLFLARTSDPSYQIHLPLNDGSATGANPALFHTGNDGSNLDLTAQGGANNAGRSYVNSSGLPFALNFPELVPWSEEKTAIQVLFPDITSFATTAGKSSTSFYEDDVNEAASWQQRLSAAPPPPPTPTATGGAAFTGVTLCTP